MALASAGAPALAVSDRSLSIGGLSQEHCLECLRECGYSPRAARDALACKDTAHVTWNKVTRRVTRTRGGARNPAPVHVRARADARAPSTLPPPRATRRAPPLRSPRCASLT
jgi:hypothetical protein